MHMSLVTPDMLPPHNQFRVSSEGRESVCVKEQLWLLLMIMGIRIAGGGCRCLI